MSFPDSWLPIQTWLAKPDGFFRATFSWFEVRQAVGFVSLALQYLMATSVQIDGFFFLSKKDSWRFQLLLCCTVSSLCMPCNSDVPFPAVSILVLRLGCQLRTTNFCPFFSAKVVVQTSREPVKCFCPPHWVVWFECPWPGGSRGKAYTVLNRLSFTGLPFKWGVNWHQTSHQTSAPLFKVTPEYFEVFSSLPPPFFLPPEENQNVIYALAGFAIIHISMRW